MATFTVQLELGPETRALIERIAGKAVIQIELGERTRELLAELAHASQRDESRRERRKGV